MESDLKGSLQFESDKSSTEYESQVDVLDEPKVTRFRFALVFCG